MKYLLLVSALARSVFSSLICPLCVAAKVDISVWGKKHWQLLRVHRWVSGNLWRFYLTVGRHHPVVRYCVSQSDRSNVQWKNVASTVPGLPNPQNFRSELARVLKRPSVAGCHGNAKDETKHLIWPRLNRLVVILLEKSNLLIFGQRIARHIKAGGCGCWYCCGAAFRPGTVAPSPCPRTLLPGEHRRSRQPEPPDTKPLNLPSWPFRYCLSSQSECLL